MKTLKPMRAGVLCRPFEHQGRCWFAVGVLAYFDFDVAAAQRLLPDVALWTDVARAAAPGAVFDEAMPKLRGEFLVTGSAYAPGGVPCAALLARAVVGDVDKRVLVVGDRRWERGAMTSPEPFVEMPLDWRRAFGGPAHAPNPLGRGSSPTMEAGVAVHRLPNVEHPERRITAVGDQPAPAGFGALDFAWPQRSSRLGTYDAGWLRTQAPGFADDIDLGLFNVALDDQHAQGFWAGDEVVRLEHLHRDHPLLETRLPGVGARCFVTLRGGVAEAWREVGLRLDTVHLLPNLARGALVFRGLVEIAEDDAADVADLLVALEHLDAPKDAAHYRSVRDARMDRARGFAHLLRDEDLLPEPRGGATPAPLETGDRIEAAVHSERFVVENLRRRAQREPERARELLVRHGLDPSAFLPPVEDRVPPSAADVGTVLEDAQRLLDEHRARGESRREEAWSAVRAACATHGIDFEATFGASPRRHPIRFQARLEMARLEALRTRARSMGGSSPEIDALLDDPAFEARLIHAEDQLREVYRAHAHHLDAAARREGLDGDAVRAHVKDLAARRQSLADLDLSGADLAGLDLRDADLRGSFLDNADLRGADLRGANLWRAVACRADLTDVRLEGALVGEANLGGASLVRAKMAGLVFERTVLAGADLTGAVLDGARFVGGDLSEAVLTEASLAGVEAHGLLLRKVSWSRARAPGARFVKCTFLECSLREGRFDDVALTSSVFVQCDLQGVSLRGAQADNVRVVQGCDLGGIDLRGASMRSATVRDTRMCGAVLADADLRGSDFSGSDLADAVLLRAVASDARFVRTNLDRAVLTACDLRNALLGKASLQDAVLDGANLFRADLARFRGRPLRFEDAFVVQARVLAPRGPVDGP